MTLINSIKKDLEDNIKNVYKASPELIQKFLELAQQNDSYGKKTNTHFTSSAIVIDNEAENILLLNHKKYHQWLAFGGHWNDNDYKQETIFQGAIREMFEEGFNNEHVHFNPLNNSFPINLDIHQAAGHIHYDLAFLVMMNKSQSFTISNEAKDIAWINIDNLIENRNNLFNSRLVTICENIREIYPSIHVDENNHNNKIKIK